MKDDNDDDKTDNDDDKTDNDDDKTDNVGDDDTFLRAAKKGSKLVVFP